MSAEYSVNRLEGRGVITRRGPFGSREEAITACLALATESNGEKPNPLIYYKPTPCAAVEISVCPPLR